MMQKNKKAPARARAVEDHYILTTKLVCGCCGAAMTGVSGKSHTGTIYQYYQCVTNRRKGGCKKKTVQKASYIVGTVITKTVQILTPENIDKIARSVEALCEKERNTESLKHLNKLIQENGATNGKPCQITGGGKGCGCNLCAD